MRRTLFAAIAAFALSAGLQNNISARAADYTIDPSHTHILFMVNHLARISHKSQVHRGSE